MAIMDNIRFYRMNGQGPGEKNAVRPVRRGRPPGLPGHRVRVRRGLVATVPGSVFAQTRLKCGMHPAGQAGTPAPTRGVGRFGYDEAPVSGAQCVQSVGAGLPDRPAVGSYRYNQAQANPSPGSRAGGDACPYERRRAFRL